MKRHKGAKLHQPGRRDSESLRELSRAHVASMSSLSPGAFPAALEDWAFIRPARHHLLSRASFLHMSGNSSCGYEITPALLWLGKIWEPQMLAPAVSGRALQAKVVLLRMPWECVLTPAYWESPHKQRFQRSIVLGPRRIFLKDLAVRKWPWLQNTRASVRNLLPLT